MTEQKHERRLIDLRAVQAIVGLKSAAIYERVSAGQFPAPVRISSRCTRWFSDEIQRWVDELPRGVGKRPATPNSERGEAA